MRWGRAQARQRIRQLNASGNCPGRRRVKQHGGARLPAAQLRHCRDGAAGCCWEPGGCSDRWDHSPGSWCRSKKSRSTKRMKPCSRSSRTASHGAAAGFSKAPAASRARAARACLKKWNNMNWTVPTMVAPATQASAGQRRGHVTSDPRSCARSLMSGHTVGMPHLSSSIGSIV